MKINLSTPWGRWHLGGVFCVDLMGTLAVNVIYSSSLCEERSAWGVKIRRKMLQTKCMLVQIPQTEIRIVQYYKVELIFISQMASQISWYIQ